ncbi:MAG: ABC transporter substrate-binding protein [Haloarculaceae archaeon]
MSRKVLRRKVLQGIGAAGVAGLAGCSQAGGGGGSSRTVNLGVLMPLTGDLGALGKKIRDGGLLPATQLNDADVPITVDTQVEDTQTNPTAGVSAAESLVNAGYPMVMGPASSGVNLQVSKEVFIPSKVVGCSPSSTSPNVTTLQDNDFVFRTAPSDALQGQVMAQVATDKIGASTAATMYVNNDYGQALSKSFADSFSGEVQTQVPFEKAQSSYSSVLSQALESDPDMLVVIGYPVSGKQIFRDYYAEYSGHDIMVTDGLKENSLPNDVGNDMQNVIGTAPLSAGPQVDTFNQKYKDEYGRAPSVYNAQAYDASAVMILANVVAGDNDGTGVRDNIRDVANPGGTKVGPKNLAEGVRMVADGEEVQYVGASSAVDFDDNGDMKAVSYEVWKFSDGGTTRSDTVNFGQ